MNERLRITLLAVAYLAIGVTGIVFFRYEYVPQPFGEVATHILRINRLNGETCFIPLHQHIAETLGAAGYTYDQCDASGSKKAGAESMPDKAKDSAQVDEILRGLEDAAKQAQE